MDKELVPRVRAALSLLFQAQDAVNDVFYQAAKESHLESVTDGWECRDLRSKIIGAARLDGLTDEDMGIGLPKCTANVTVP